MRIGVDESDGIFPGDFPGTTLPSIGGPYVGDVLIGRLNMRFGDTGDLAVGHDGILSGILRIPGRRISMIP
jgi:hypothetical protein